MRIDGNQLFGGRRSAVFQAAELVSVADWCLKASRPHQAQRAAEEALRIFKDIGYGKGGA